MAEALPLNKKLFDARLSGQRCALFIPRGEATGGGGSGRTGANSCWHSLVREHHRQPEIPLLRSRRPEDEDAAMGEAAARGGRLHPEILRNTRRQRFPHSLLFHGLWAPDVLAWKLQLLRPLLRCCRSPLRARHAAYAPGVLAITASIGRLPSPRVYHWGDHRGTLPSVELVLTILQSCVPSLPFCTFVQRSFNAFASALRLPAA